MMAYTITGQAESERVGALSQGAQDVPEALRKARQMLQTGLVNVTIRDGLGNEIAGNDLVACCKGTKSLTRDLKAN
jgi:hypothetical protein